MGPIWLSRLTVEAIHSESIAMFGGSAGIRDDVLLESALERPKNLLAYSDPPSPFQLAASYCYGLVQNHPFIDSNKRTGLLTATAFLSLNRYAFRPRESDAATVIILLASGSIYELTLTAWFADFSTAK